MNDSTREFVSFLLMCGGLYLVIQGCILLAGVL